MSCDNNYHHLSALPPPSSNVTLDDKSVANMYQGSHLYCLLKELHNSGTHQFTHQDRLVTLTV